MFILKESLAAPLYLFLSSDKVVSSSEDDTACG